MPTTFKSELIKDEIKKHIEEKNVLELRLKQICREIDNIQYNCDHKFEDGTTAFEYHSTDMTIDYHKCKICSKIKNKLKI